jgi:hypothetical protein
MSDEKEIKVEILSAKELLIRNYENTHARMGELIEEQKLLIEEIGKLSQSLIKFKAMIIYVENQDKGKEQ